MYVHLTFTKNTKKYILLRKVMRMGRHSKINHATKYLSQDDQNARFRHVLVQNWYFVKNHFDTSSHDNHDTANEIVAEFAPSPGYQMDSVMLLMFIMMGFISRMSSFSIFFIGMYLRSYEANQNQCKNHPSCCNSPSLHDFQLTSN